MQLPYSTAINFYRHIKRIVHGFQICCTYSNSYIHIAQPNPATYTENITDYLRESSWVVYLLAIWSTISVLCCTISGSFALFCDTIFAFGYNVLTMPTKLVFFVLSLVTKDSEYPKFDIQFLWFIRIPASRNYTDYRFSPGL